MAASEGAATLVLKSHTERLKEEQKRENQKKKEQELANAGQAKSQSEFSSGVKMGFAAGLPSAPVHQMKVKIIHTHLNALIQLLEYPQGNCHGRSTQFLLSIYIVPPFLFLSNM